MTFLELVNRLALECGVSGPELTDVTGQTGEAQRLVTWVNAAWTDIQNTHQDWDWMRTSASFTTVNGRAEYPLGAGAGTAGVSVATFNRWARDTARNYLTSIGTDDEIFMDWIPYDAWRNTYQYGAIRDTVTRPVQFSISPDKGICLGPSPLVGYTITCDYFTAPTDLEVNADAPTMPAQWQMAIVYRRWRSSIGR
jgi:hypothetical protein